MHLRAIYKVFHFLFCLHMNYYCFFKHLLSDLSMLKNLHIPAKKKKNWSLLDRQSRLEDVIILMKM